MVLSKEQISELEELAKPVMKWINDNCRPHVKVIVDCDSAEIVEGVALVKTDEFIKD